MGTLAAGIKEIFATAKTTGSNVLLCGNDGTPDGHMTMANLASVLGGLEWAHATTKINGVDLDTIITSNVGKVEVYECGSACTHQPISGLDGYMIVFRWHSGFYCTQIYINPNMNIAHIRSNRYADHMDWTNWEEYTMNMPTFYKNYSDLASLANALGAINGLRIIGIPKTTIPEGETKSASYTNYPSILFIREYFYNSEYCLVTTKGNGVHVIYESDPATLSFENTGARVSLSFSSNNINMQSNYNSTAYVYGFALESIRL